MKEELTEYEQRKKAIMVAKAKVLFIAEVLSGDCSEWKALNLMWHLAFVDLHDLEEFRDPLSPPA